MYTSLKRNKDIIIAILAIKKGNNCALFSNIESNQFRDYFYIYFVIDKLYIRV